MLGLGLGVRVRVRVRDVSQESGGLSYTFRPANCQICERGRLVSSSTN